MASDNNESTVDITGEAKTAADNAEDIAAAAQTKYTNNQTTGNNDLLNSIKTYAIDARTASTNCNDVIQTDIPLGKRYRDEAVKAKDDAQRKYNSMTSV